MELWVLILGTILTVAAWLAFGFELSWLWVALAAVFLSSLAVAFQRRRRAVEFFVERLQLPIGERPNIVAHSMGTYLIGAALRKRRDGVDVNHMILTGCVLPTRYPWQKIHESRPSAFETIQNEVGENDPVPWLAYVAHICRLLPGFGMAGRKGFGPLGSFIHTAKDPVGCESCRKNGSVARVHNIFGPYGHNSVLNAAHAAYYWLPWLWGKEAFQYQRWIETCLAANEHYQNRDKDRNWPRLRIAEEELLAWRWKGSSGKTLQAEITNFINYHPRKTQVQSNVTGQILCELYQSVARARKAHQERGRNWENEIRCLDPEIALTRAVNTIMES